MAFPTPVNSQITDAVVEPSGKKTKKSGKAKKAAKAKKATKVSKTGKKTARKKK